MSEAVLTALITGGLSLIGVVVTCLMTSKRTTNEVTHKLELQQAVTKTQIDTLRDEVHKHNNVIERTFVLEGKMEEVQHDIRDLKAYHKPKPVD